MLQNKTVFALFFISFLAHSQIGGKTTYTFLNLMSSPRQAALGGKVITIFDEDVNQALLNPAAINEEMHNHMSVNYGNYYGEVTYGSASYAYTYDRHLQTFQAGVNYINYGTFEGYDERGTPTSNFTGSETALSVGYAYLVPNSTIRIGTNARLIASSLEQYTSYAGALDLGVLYIDEKNDINWALVLRNMGAQFKSYAGLRESLPFEVILGVSQELDHVPIRWHLTLENLQQWKVAFSNPARAQTTIDDESVPEKVSALNNAFRHVVVGIEMFPKKALNLRLGYNFRRAEELSIVDQRSFSGLSVGFGLRMNKIKFDYSYSRFNLAGNTSLFGLTINLME